jgi:ABC-2 type transport system permease protein
MTFLQQTLGKNYKWWYALKYNLNLSMAYIIPSLFIIVRDFLPLLVSLIIYGSFLDTKDFATYFIIANIFFKICSMVWDIAWDIKTDVMNGGLTTKLMRPSSIIGQYFVVTIGANMYSIIVNALIFLIIIPTLNVQIPINLISIFPAFVMLFIGFLIFLSIDILLGSLTFWLKEIAPLIETRSVLFPFLAGGLVLLPANKITAFFIYLPFSFGVYHPTQIYLGKYSTAEIVYTFLGGIAWCFVLWLLARVIFKLGLKRNEAVGL